MKMDLVVMSRPSHNLLRNPPHFLSRQLGGVARRFASWWATVPPEPRLQRRFRFERPNLHLMMVLGSRKMSYDWISVRTGFLS